MSISAGSISYEIDGMQYIAVVGAAARVPPLPTACWSTSSAARSTLPPRTAAAPQVLNPPANFGDACAAGHGQELYTQNCTSCHEGGRGMGGSRTCATTPMLQNAALFKAIVFDGALTENGMMSFNKSLSPEDVEAIRSHLSRLPTT